MDILSFGARLLMCGVAALMMLVARVASADDRFAGMDSYIREAMQKWEVPGLAIAVVKDGELVIARGYGVSELGKDRKVTEDTVFPIASCTKSFTAACVAMLVDEGKLGWDDPVRKHLPDFRVADPYVTEHITIRDLLCHRTGLVRGDLLSMTGGFSRAEMLQRVQFLEQAAPFRGKFTYHNVMFAVLGEIIEKKSGMDWHKFVATRILEPLGMTSTTTDRSLVPADRLAMRHRFYDTALAPLRTPLSDPLTAEAGAIHSTVGDMAKWLRFQLREGEHNGQQLIVNQFEAAFCTLKTCIDRCPDAAWDAPVANLKFCQVAFHALFYADFYLGQNADALRRQPFHRDHEQFFRDYEELEDRVQVLLYDKPSLNTYLEHCRMKAAEVIVAETAVSLAGPSGFERRTFSRAELHVLNIRHIQHHAAQLSLRLRLDPKQDIPWIGSGWREVTE